MEELSSWLQAKSGIPENDDEAFILDYEISDDKSPPSLHVLNEENIRFKFTVSTKRLLENALKFSKIHVDNTYKLNWAGYPVTVIGLSDCDHVFHLLALGISTNETQSDFKFFFNSIKNTVLEICLEQVQFNTLVSDCSMAIINGFHSVFPHGENIICWAHVKMNLLKQKFVDADNKASILKDIDILQLCPNKEAFSKASVLLYKKWTPLEKVFMNYLKKYWLDKNNSWFEGVNILTPSTNNCVEGTNSRLKIDFTFRERPRFSKFKDRIIEIVENFSVEYKSAFVI